MNIVFFGSTEYSVEILKELLREGLKPLVVTMPDRPKGRGLKVSSTPVKILALENNLELVTPTKVRDKDFVSLLRNNNPDIYMVVSYGKILPKEILQIPAIMPVGIHPSLLPKYRGAAPINWALINAETKTGVMLFKLTPGMDEGPIIAKEEITIDQDDDFLSLSEKIYSASRNLLKKTLPLIAEKKFTLKNQVEKGASLAPKIDKETVKIDWQMGAEDIRNLVRGVIPAPCAWSYFREKRIKFWKGSCEPDTKVEARPGEIVTVLKDRLKIKTKKGLFLPTSLQPEGKKRMDIVEFINGYHPTLGERFY
jgi:methionyl-tRNA formyltransferase